MDGAIVEFSQIFILCSKRKIQRHQKKLLEKQTKRFPTKLSDFFISHCAQIHSIMKILLISFYRIFVFLRDAMNRASQTDFVYKYDRECFIRNYRGPFMGKTVPADLKKVGKGVQYYS